MADLEVDVSGLEAIAASLSGLAQGLDDTSGQIHDAVGIMGSGDLADALLSFDDKWDDGRGQIKKNMDGIEQALSDAAKAYRDTDQELSDALTKDQTTTTNMTGS